MTATVQTHGITRLFATGETTFAAIENVSFELQPGEFTAIMGPSGSGKSTFMSIVGCLDRGTSALENAELPMVYASVPAQQRHEAARKALDDVGLDERHHRSMPNELSGGQQQRVAIARALVNNPSLILADEPTGALDSKTSKDLMELFLRLNRERGMTILMVTHELDIARYSNRIVSFLDGHIVNDEPVVRAKAGSAT